MRRQGWALVWAMAVFGGVASCLAEDIGSIRVGIVGLDAHAPVWIEILNNPKTDPAIRAMKIVAATPSYSPDIPFSVENVKVGMEAMRKNGVELVPTVEALLPKVDAVMVLSIDGRTRWKEVAPVFAAHKRVYIDKPVAASLVDIVRIAKLGERTGTPWFSNSALRYAPHTVDVVAKSPVGRILGCDAYSSNAPLEPHHPDLFYYGIHGCETLFGIMGTGCETVQRVRTPTADLAIGVWQGGRLGTFRGILQGKVGYGATVFGEKGIANVGKFEGYEPLLSRIAEFFKTGKTPIDVKTILEVYAFLEAADESKRQSGAPVSLASVLEKAEKAAASSPVPAANAD
ncbi:MAG: Gfo/Idh/MocA family oxidoreductase [Thermoguttaceae bacterium]